MCDICIYMYIVHTYIHVHIRINIYVSVHIYKYIINLHVRHIYSHIHMLVNNNLRYTSRVLPTLWLYTHAMCASHVYQTRTHFGSDWIPIRVHIHILTIYVSPSKYARVCVALYIYMSSSVAVWVVVCVAVWVLVCVAVWVVVCVAVFCRVLQYVAMCCSVFVSSQMDVLGFDLGMIVPLTESSPIVCMWHSGFTHTHTHTYTHTHTQVHTHTHTYMHTRTRMHKHTCKWVTSWMNEQRHVYIRAMMKYFTVGIAQKQRLRTATHCSTLQHTTVHCNTLQHTAAYRNAPQHTATHCNTLQHTSFETEKYDSRTATWCNNETHCKTRQYPATHCSTM